MGASPSFCPRTTLWSWYPPREAAGDLVDPVREADGVLIDAKVLVAESVGGRSEWHAVAPLDALSTAALCPDGGGVVERVFWGAVVPRAEL